MRAAPLILLLLFPVFVQAKEHAVIHKDVQQFTMNSKLTGSLEVEREVTVYDEWGLFEASIVVYTSEFESLSSFSGSLDDGSGKVKKLKKSDLVSVSIASGLAGDGFLTSYIPSASYPFTVKYKYTKHYRKGYHDFPSFFPLMTENVSLNYGSFTLIVPSGTRIHTKSRSMKGTERKEKNNDVYCWECQSYPGYVAEDSMPSPRSFLPQVHAAPVDFTYDGISGTQENWTSLGGWLYELMRDSDDLPSATVKRIQESSSSDNNKLETIRRIWNELRDKTRYVSIQFGIGGYRPFKASLVDKSGLGDCKALSNYMRCMLKAAGVDSYYTVLNTDSARLDRDFSCLSQSNHVMLCVPLPEAHDTLWLECTNPATPLGYRHDDIAGHDVLLVKEDGGSLMEVPPYPDSLQTSTLDTKIALEADGSAHLAVIRKDCCSLSEGWIGFTDRPVKEQRDKVLRNVAFHVDNYQQTSYRNNFNEYDGRGWIPEAEIGYSFDVRSYAQSLGDRLILPVNPISKRMGAQRSKRVNPLVIRNGSHYIDKIVISIPHGYSVERLPGNIELDEKWGHLSSKIENIGGSILITQSISLTPVIAAPEAYDSYREFARKVNMAFKETIVLQKKRPHL